MKIKDFEERLGEKNAFCCNLDKTSAGATRDISKNYYSKVGFCIIYVNINPTKATYLHILVGLTVCVKKIIAVTNIS